MLRSEFKRDGAGRGNWGNQSEEINQYFFTACLKFLCSSTCFVLVILINFPPQGNSGRGG